MTTELVRGQNVPLGRTRVEIRLSAGAPVVPGATLGDAEGRLSGIDAVVHPGASRRPGIEVPRHTSADHRITVDLEALPGDVHRVSVLLALPGAGERTGRQAHGFGATAAPSVTVSGTDGTELARYRLDGLDAETAVVAVELYRRQGVWKVRAVGQGYAGGLAALLHDQGLPQAAAVAATIEQAARPGKAHTAPGSAPVPEPGPAAAQEAERPAAARYAVTPYASGEELLPDGAPPPPPPLPPSPLYADPEPPKNDPTPSGGAMPSGDATPSGDSAPPGGPIDYRHPKRRTAPATAEPAAPDAPRPLRPADDGGPAPDGPRPPVAGDAAGWTMDERLYNQVWGMFEDLARSVAGYRSAADFARRRREKELDELLADPRNRLGAAADTARAAARDACAELISRARGDLDRDLAQLTAEAEVVEPALPPAYARWDSPVWQGYHVPLERPMAMRLGDLQLPEAPGLRIPLLARLPLERGLWIDSGHPVDGRGEVHDPQREFGRRELGSALTDGPLAEAERQRLAMDTAVALAARLLAIHPAGQFAVQVIDPDRTAASALAPLRETGALGGTPSAGAKGVAEVLEAMTRRVDLVQMAVRNRALESLPPDLDTAEQLLIVNDFPHGFDDRAVNQLRYLADEGPAGGVHLMMVADRARSREFGPVLDPLWRALMRITPVPDAHLADPWVGHAWTYEPALVPRGSQVVRQVLGRLAEARRRADQG